MKQLSHNGSNQAYAKTSHFVIWKLNCDYFNNLVKVLTTFKKSYVSVLCVCKQACKNNYLS